ncbi:hypothetical protein H4582DRAFT_2063227 [Lactarius indigo]|nr:hypothetical protein H4582DRAFT_2063227 [Lactarius indigo]
MSVLRPPSSPSPGPSPVQGQNGKNPSARSSMGPAACRPPVGGPSAGFQSHLTAPWRRAPSGRPTSEFIGSATFQISNPISDLRTFTITKSCWTRWLLPLSTSIIRRGLSAVEQRSWFSEAERTAALYSLLQHSAQRMARTDPMTALLSPAIGGSMQSQMEAKLASMNLKSPGLKSTMPGSPSARTFNTSTTNRQLLAFDSSSSFLSPYTANTVGNPSDATATLAQQRAKLKAAGNEAHRISAPALASSGERGTWAGVLGQVAERDNSPTQEISVEPGCPFPGAPTFLASPPAPLSVPLVLMAVPRPAVSTGCPPPSATVGPACAGQTVDLAAAKLNYLYGSHNVPRLDGPDKFRWPSKGHIHDNSSGSNNGVTNNGVYGDDGDLIQGHHLPDFEVVCRKMGIDDQTAPPPPPAPQSSGGPGLTGSGGGLSSA